MWCVPELDEDYIAKMEDVLETYERRYDEKEPVVCLDEKPVTLHADIRPTVPAQPGREARRDSDYARRGTANVFCAVEPKAGHHFTFPTPVRSGFEFARVICRLALEYPAAETIHLVIGQSQYPPPQIPDGRFWRRSGRRDLGPIYRSLHPQARKLAQSGGNRNRHVRQAMPRQSKASRPKDSSAAYSCLESSDQSRWN